MNAIGYLVGMLLIVGYVWNLNFHTGIDERAVTSADALSGQLRAYGSYAGNYARANPTADASITDAQAALPTWLTKPSGARAWARGGKAFAYITPTSQAEGYAAARACKPSQVCGMVRSGHLYQPGKVASVSVSLPAAIPDGSLVYVR